MERIDSRVRYVWAVGSLTTAVVVGALVTAGIVLVWPGRTWVGGAFAAAVAMLGLVHAIYRYRRWRYELQDDALHIQRGVLTHVRTLVPYVRVQHVDSQRSPVERTVGLASVVVYTAGSRRADVTIPGLTPARAEALQERLREMAVESGTSDAV